LTNPKDTDAVDQFWVILIKSCAYFVFNIFCKSFEGLGFFSTSLHCIDEFTTRAKLLTHVFTVLRVSSHLTHLP